MPSRESILEYYEHMADRSLQIRPIAEGSGPTVSRVNGQQDGMKAASVDISAWLRSLGLERYEAAFRDHEID